MAFTLYNAPQSTCSQRVRYLLHAKGLAFAEHRLDLFRGDQLKPDYLAINPNGVVPALVHDGRTVIDSAVIMEYLEDILPDVAPSRPADPHEAARMRAMIRFIDEIPTPAIRVPLLQSGLSAALPLDERGGVPGACRQQAAAPRIPAEDGPDRLSQGGDGRGARPSPPRGAAHGRLAGREPADPG